MYESKERRSRIRRNCWISDIVFCSCNFPDERPILYRGRKSGGVSTICFFNWWGILAAAVALFYGLSKTVYTENRLWKYGILILSAMLLIYAVISLLLWII